ncbi:MAG: hypothetical protein ABEJ72_05440, partial [Candidatus Aenigmatarchaeota archaeon]
MDRLVLTETGRYGTEELKAEYFEDSRHAMDYIGEFFDYVEIRENSGKDAAEIAEFFKSF